MMVNEKPARRRGGYTDESFLPEELKGKKYLG